MERKLFATRIDPKLIKSLKMLSVKQEKPNNALLEEAIKDLLKKHNQKIEK